MVATTWKLEEPGCANPLCDGKDVLARNTVGQNAGGRFQEETGQGPDGQGEAQLRRLQAALGEHYRIERIDQDEVLREAIGVDAPKGSPQASVSPARGLESAVDGSEEASEGRSHWGGGS